MKDTQKDKARDDVLRQMLNTLPDPRKAKKSKQNNKKSAS